MERPLDRGGGEPLPLGIPNRIHRKLTQETAEVMGGVTAGSLTFIWLYEGFLAAASLDVNLLATIGFSMAAAITGDTVVYEAKRVLRGSKSS